MIIQNSNFTNNIGQIVNHGISIVSSDVSVSTIKVLYTDAEFLTSYQNTDSGFFSLNYMSNLRIGNNSVFENCRGALSSVLYATGSSNVTFGNGTLIKNSLSQTGSTLYLTITY